MKKVTLTIFGLFLTTTISAQTIFGKWENRDQETGDIDSIVEVYEKEEKAYAKIIHITDLTRRKDLCVKCKGKNKDKPILGMDILTGLSKGNKEWSGGEILDPKNGAIYKCFITLKNKDNLKIRGYLGFSLFGKTVYWQRKK